MRLPGLDPDRRYRVAPVPVGRPPTGLLPPAWWRTGPVPAAHGQDAGHRDLVWPAGVEPADVGVVVSGAVLAGSGLMSPQVDPDHVVLLSVTAVD